MRAAEMPGHYSPRLSPCFTPSLLLHTCKYTLCYAPSPMLACLATDPRPLQAAQPSSLRGQHVPPQQHGLQRPRASRRQAVSGAASDFQFGAPSAPAAAQSQGLSPRFTLGQEVGRGSFAVVLEAFDTASGARLAAKKLPKYVHGRLPSAQAEVVAREAAMQASLSAACPSVLRLVDMRQDDNYWFILSELCVSDLRAYLKQRNGGPLREREAAHIVRQLLSALAACHRAGVAFRDVKPANLLVRSIDANGMPQVALADFGCARSSADPQTADRSSPGTPLYSAPECVNGSGGVESDVWAAGVLLYHLLSGAYPFCNPRHKITQGEFFRRVAEAPISTAGPAWQGVSPGAVALVRRMLDRDCSSRITAAQALNDPWLLDMTSSTCSHAGSPSSSSSATLGTSSNNAVALPGGMPLATAASALAAAACHL